MSAPTWIKTTDELPTRFISILFVVNGRVCCGEITYSGNWLDKCHMTHGPRGTEYKTEQVSHWMKFPEAPSTPI